MTFASIRNPVNFYLPFANDSVDAVEAEFMRWRSYWLDHESDSLPYNTLGVLLSAKEIKAYPSLEVLLQIDILETYLWFTTKEARLNGLVLLFVHRGLNIDFEHVIDEFSRKNCRLNFN